MKIPNPHVFREYDIRGVADRDLPDEFALALGKALGSYWLRQKAERVVVSRDCRLSSPRLHAAIARGILSTGLFVVDVGVMPTPLMYFSVFHLEWRGAGKTGVMHGGVQITGSHNPAPENGFKVMSGRDTLSGEVIQQLRVMIENDDFEVGRGELVTMDPLPAYAGFMRGNIHMGTRPVRFAIDAGNGTGGPATLAAMSALGISGTTMLMEPDGHFPVHHPDPSQQENLDLLVRTVRHQNLDVGIAYDGDADRIGLIDARGETIWGDKLMVLLSREILKTRPGAPILGEVKCSQVMYDDITKHGGRAIMWKTGHSLIKKKMKEEHALLAGEMSGHVFFADRYFGFDDAIYAALRVLEILSHTDLALHELLADLPLTFATPELRMDCPDAVKFQVVERVKHEFRKTHSVNETDGARIQCEGGWGLVRASNTQPILVLRFEGDTERRRDEIRALIESRALAVVAELSGSIG